MGAPWRPRKKSTPHAPYITWVLGPLLEGSNTDDLSSQVHLLSHLGSSQRMLAWMVLGPPAETIVVVVDIFTDEQQDEQQFHRQMDSFSLKSFLQKIYFCTTWKVDGATPMYWLTMAPYKSPPVGSGDCHLLSLRRVYIYICMMYIYIYLNYISTILRFSQQTHCPYILSSLIWGFS